MMEAPAERLDVAGRVKAEAIVFSDGSVLTSAAQVQARQESRVVSVPRSIGPALPGQGDATISPGAPAFGPSANAVRRPQTPAANANPVPSALTFGGQAPRCAVSGERGGR